MARGKDIDFADKFRAWLAGNNGLSSNSIDAYVYDLGKFRAFLNGRGVDLASAAPGDVEDFVEHSMENQESPRSTARALTALRRFYEYLRKEGRVQRDPSRDISMPTAKRRPPRILSPDRIRACLESFREDDPLQFRNKLICTLLYKQALRISELCELKITDLDANLSGLLIGGRPAGARRRALSPDEQIALRAYLNDARLRINSGPAGDYLFPSRTGGPLHRKSVWRMLRKHLERRGLSEDLTPRVLRHSRAVHLLTQGVEAREVRNLLGNVDVGTMRKYIRLARSGT